MKSECGVMLTSLRDQAENGMDLNKKGE